jgi:hypothetical protein
MSFVYDSNNVKDNEQRKFQPDSAGNTAVNVISSDLVAALNQINATLLLVLAAVSGLPANALIDNNNETLVDDNNEILVDEV